MRKRHRNRQCAGPPHSPTKEGPRAASSLLGDRAPDQRVGRYRLATVLGPEAIQDDMSLPAPNVDESSLAVELATAEQPAGEQRVAGGRIAGDGRGCSWISDLECRSVLEPDGRHGRGEASRNRARAVELERKNRTPRIKVVVAATGEDVLDRELQPVGHHRRRCTE